MTILQPGNNQDTLGGPLTIDDKKELEAVLKPIHSSIRAISIVSSSLNEREKTVIGNSLDQLQEIIKSLRE